MARSSKSGKRAARRAAAKAGKPVRAPIAPQAKAQDEVTVGNDFGVAGLTLSIANNAFIEQLGRAAIWGCAYGYIGRCIIPYTSPTLSLIGEHPDRLRAAMETMREWCRIGGPGAVKVEIGFSGAGYVLTISQDSRSLAWRTLGFGNVVRPTSFNLSWGKRMDSRHPMLDSIADYARAPFAPLHLYASVGSMDASYAAQPVERCDPILLERIWIYRDESEIPRHSPLGAMLNRLGDQEAGPNVTDPPTPYQMTPAGVLKERDEALLSLLPKTLLVLRHRQDGQRLVAQVMEHGFTRWQVEQALANLRLAEVASKSPPSRQAEALRMLRQSYAEYAGQDYSPADIEVAAVIEQIDHDLGNLLSTVSSAELPEGVIARMARLREIGYD